MKLPYSVHRPTEAIAIALLAANAAAAFWFYAHFPARVPIHWNIAGQADGWSDPAFAAFFFPALIIGIYLLLLFLPLADPKRDRYREFARPYQALRVGIIGMMSALYFTASLAGTGYPVSIGRVVPFGIGILFMVIGNFLPKMRQNWFVGIRTPWTLSSEDIWDRTHRVGGKAFVGGGLLMILTSFLPPMFAFIATIGATVLITVGTVVFSWILWRKQRP